MLLFEGMGETSLDDQEDSQKATNKHLSTLTTIKHLLKSADAVLILFFSMFLMHCMTIYAF